MKILGFPKQPFHLLPDCARPTKLPNRFWSKIQKTDSCWNWIATLTRGYGHFSLKGKMIYAHRLAYEDLIGPIPTGYEIDHLCRNPKCVNPLHLEPVTKRENIFRGNSFAPKLAKRTHCKNGHALIGDNLRIRKKRYQRICLACKRESCRKNKYGNSPF